MHLPECVLLTKGLDGKEMQMRATWLLLNYKNAKRDARILFRAGQAELSRDLGLHYTCTYENIFGGEHRIKRAAIFSTAHSSS